MHDVVGELRRRLGEPWGVGVVDMYCPRRAAYMSTLPLRRRLSVLDPTRIELGNMIDSLAKAVCRDLGGDTDVVLEYRGHRFRPDCVVDGVVYEFKWSFRRELRDVYVFQVRVYMALLDASEGYIVIVSPGGVDARRVERDDSVLSLLDESLAWLGRDWRGAPLRVNSLCAKCDLRNACLSGATL